MTATFNIRVYGLVISDDLSVLVSDEHVFGRNIVKFPGGGLQFGEGTHDCLRREFREELDDAEIKVNDHFYTTDFFQPSFFNPSQQVISIYYFVDLKNIKPLQVATTPFDFKVEKEGAQAFRWLSNESAMPDEITFPIDQKVVSLLKNHFFSL